MKTLPTFCVLFLVIAAPSCKKDEIITPAIYITFAKDALAYAQLPLNRYFIYKDSATGNLDSVVVTNSELLTLFEPAYSPALFSFSPAHPAYYYQRFTLRLNKLNGAQTIWYNANASCSPLGSAYISTNSLASLIMYSYDNFMAFNATTSCLGFSYNPSNPGSLQKLSIEGNIYNDVLKIVTTTGADSDSAQSWYYRGICYWVKDVGIVKRTGKTNTGNITANLVRYGR